MGYNMYLYEKAREAYYQDLRPKKCVPCKLITTSPIEFSSSHLERMIPRLALLLEALLSRTVKRPSNTSSGRTGRIQRTSSTPGEPMLTVSLISPSTSRRMKSAVVCQPLAISSPKNESFARSGSV